MGWTGISGLIAVQLLSPMQCQWELDLAEREGATASESMYAMCA